MTGDIVLDVGAHHGIYAIELLRRAPEVRVIAVEPSPESARAAARNLERNGLTGRVELIQAALGSRDGMGTLVRPHGRSWGDRVHRVEAGREAPASTVTVRICSVESVLKGRIPRLVKLNAEGAEYEVLPEMLRLGIRPEMILLFAHGPEADRVALLELLRASGYDVRDADDPPRGVRVHCRVRPEARC